MPNWRTHCWHVADVLMGYSSSRASQLAETTTRHESSIAPHPRVARSKSCWADKLTAMSLLRSVCMRCETDAVVHHCYHLNTLDNKSSCPQDSAHFGKLKTLSCCTLRTSIHRFPLCSKSCRHHDLSSNLYANTHVLYVHCTCHFDSVADNLTHFETTCIYKVLFQIRSVRLTNS